jgi:6-pyruvoyltetrahydropterin/6-carboxytetrahydropterin synthase
MLIFKDFSLDSAHLFPTVPPGKICLPMHMHAYKLSVFVKGLPGTHKGWIMDITDLNKAVEEMLQTPDQVLLH